MSTEEHNEDYTSRTGQKDASVPVQSDKDEVEDPIDADTADSDKTLEADEAAAMDKSNIVKERTRNAGKGPQGSMREPGDEEGIPTDD